MGALRSLRKSLTANESHTEYWGIASDKGKIIVEPVYEKRMPFNSAGLAIGCKRYHNVPVTQLQLVAVDNKGRETPLAVNALPSCFVGVSRLDCPDLIPQTEER